MSIKATNRIDCSLIVFIALDQVSSFLMKGETAIIVAYYKWALNSTKQSCGIDYCELELF